jgi:predicted PurR-regulated permease PerM
MIRDFLMALLLAAIFSALANPLYRKILDKVGGREAVAAVITLVILILGVLVPALALIQIASTQATQLIRDIVSFVSDLDTNVSGFSVPDWMPFRDDIQNAAPQLATKVGDLVGKLASFFVSSLSTVTRGTASFFLNLFIMVYAMGYFLREKTSVLFQLMRYSGLPPAFQEHLVDRVVSISRATIKGTLLIGIAQGALGGIGFWVVDIPGAVFWGAVMMIASIIPGIGPALVWVPAVIYLISTGETVSAIGLGLWCGLVVGTIDNIMRPALVGKDTQMPDLIVLVSTLGGLAMFGAVGLIIGPVIAGLFLTMWELFEATFSDLLLDPPTDSSEDTPGENS